MVFAVLSALQISNLRDNGKGPAGSTRGVLPASSGEIFGALPVSGYTKTRTLCNKGKWPTRSVIAIYVSF
jgi:hypothetical protein